MKLPALTTNSESFRKEIWNLLSIVCWGLPVASEMYRNKYVVELRLKLVKLMFSHKLMVKESVLGNSINFFVIGGCSSIVVGGDD